MGNPRKLWEVHASLGSAYNRLGRHSEAKDQWGVAAEVIRKQADGLSDQELKESFLTADLIREILSKAAS